MIKKLSKLLRREPTWSFVAISPTTRDGNRRNAGLAVTKQSHGGHSALPGTRAGALLLRAAAGGADPVSSGQVHGRDLGESGLGQELAVLGVGQVGGAEQRHHYAVEKPQGTATVCFGNQRKSPTGLEDSQDFTNVGRQVSQ